MAKKRKLDSSSGDEQLVDPFHSVDEEDEYKDPLKEGFGLLKEYLKIDAVKAFFRVHLAFLLVCLVSLHRAS